MILSKYQEGYQNIKSLLGASDMWLGLYFDISRYSQNFMILLKYQGGYQNVKSLLGSSYLWFGLIF